MLSIIIVNYRSARHLLECLRSIRTYDEWDHFEIIVVDNDGTDGAQALIEAAFSGVVWINAGGNLGFARANNIGINASRGDTCLLLNPDTLVQSRAISNTYAGLRASSWVACGLQLLNPDQSPQISGNFTMIGGLNHLLPLPYIGFVLKKIGALAGVKQTNIPEATTEREVDWINGAFLMVKKEVIHKAGLFDEDFFLYFEEAEWCSRIKKTGRLGLFGQYNVTHLQGEASNDAFNSTGKGYYNLYDRKGLQIMVSCFLRVRKEFGLFWLFVHLVTYWVTVPLFLFIGTLHRIIQFKNPLPHWKKAGAFIANLIRLFRWLPPMILRRSILYKVL